MFVGHKRAFLVADSLHTNFSMEGESYGLVKFLGVTELNLVALSNEPIARGARKANLGLRWCSGKIACQWNGIVFFGFRRASRNEFH